MRVAINESTLTAIGDAIREKTDTTDLLAPGAMPAAIRSITTGEGGGSDVELEKIDLQGKDCSYMFLCLYDNCWDELLNKYGTVLFEDGYSVIAASQMFRRCEVETMPFYVAVRGERYFINQTGSGADDIDMSHIYWDCVNLIEQPKSSPVPYNVYDPTSYYVYIDGMYRNCQKLKEININDWFWDAINKYILSCDKMFKDCYSLRKVTGLSNIDPINSGKVYDSLFDNCYVLDKVVMKSIKKKSSNNLFESAFDNCHRLKEFRLSGGTREWLNQVIDLSSGIGYDNTGNCSKYLEDTSKEVKGESSYNDYKNDPDYWTKDVAYSRYNKESAAQTLIYLPDTSDYVLANGGGGQRINTIKFRGDSGSATDGGAIDTLSESEIAAAAAKGWTVTFIY